MMYYKILFSIAIVCNYAGTVSGMVQVHRLLAQRAFVALCKNVRHASTLKSFVTLKNGSKVSEQEVRNVMHDVITLATDPAPASAPALVYLVKASFDKINFDPESFFNLRHMNLTDHRGYLSDNAKSIIQSAVEFDIHNPELSIISSPRENHVLDRPYLLHSSEFNMCSSLSPLAWLNRACMCGSDNVREVQFWVGKLPFKKPFLKQEFFTEELLDNADHYVPRDFIEGRVDRYYSGKFDDIWHLDARRFKGFLSYFAIDEERFVQDGLGEKK